LEWAREDDLEALLDLERRSYTHPWTAQHFREEIARPPGGGLLVLRGRGERGSPGRGLLGYCAYRLVADELGILNLTVAAAERGRGLGRWLLGFVLARGARGGAQRALLEVRRSNQVARALYERLGFRVLSVRPAYYADPQEDGLVLVRPELGDLAAS
jgi:ribosomal-protein-alanine N-acetyltransferase